MGDEALAFDGPEEMPVEAVAEVVEEVKAEEPKPEEPVTFDERQQAKFNEEIGRKVAKQREAERIASEEREKREVLERRLAELQAPVRPDIPPVPDPYDQDFHAKSQYRDAMLQKQAQYDAEVRLHQRIIEDAKQQEQAKEVEAFKQTAASYAEKAGKLGVQAQELQQAGTVVAQYGINERLATRILRDERGPEITVYLSRNIHELDAINGMEPEDAAVYMETVVKPKARRAPPVLAAAPTETLKGSGAPEGAGGPDGATYE
jgi:hypothetical protein